MIPPSDSAPSPAPGRTFFDVRMRGFRDRAEVADVLVMLKARLHRLTAEDVDVRQAAGRVLAQDVISCHAVPGFDRAAMDGYALKGQETFGASPYNPLEFHVVGEALPGRPFPGSVGSGQAIRIMTGAPIPDGCDAVLQAEAAEENCGRIRISEAVPPLRHVGHCGEDIAVGTTVLKAGRVLRPQDLGVMASIGVARVALVRRPQADIVVTGNELVPLGCQPEGYRIVDSNSVMLESLIERDGGVASSSLPLPDDRATLEAALLQAAGDVLMVVGGSSVGQEDHAPRVVAALGELRVHGVALRPASPTGVGFLKGRPIFLLPGNPVSCLCAYDFFAGPAIRLLGGRTTDWPHRTGRFVLARKIASAVGRVDYVRVLIKEGKIEPLAISGAAILSSTTRADGFVIVPRDSEGHADGEEVVVFLYD